MAAPGIVLFYDHSYHNRSVYLHDITAHDFGGIYRASGESSCNEEWKAYRSPDRVGFSLGICVTGNDSTPMNGERVLSDFRISDCEVYRTGGGIGLDWCDHVCCDGAIAGKNKFGDVLWERLYLHDNDIPDVSLTSLFLQCVTGAVLRDSVIDKGAGGALGGRRPSISSWHGMYWWKTSPSGTCRTPTSATNAASTSRPTWRTASSAAVFSRTTRGRRWNFWPTMTCRIRLPAGILSLRNARSYATIGPACTPIPPKSWCRTGSGTTGPPAA